MHWISLNSLILISRTIGRKVYFLTVPTIILFLLPFCQSQENLSKFGTATQSSSYFWDLHGYMSADLAITGGPTNDFYSKSCTHTELKHKVVWWQLTFTRDVFVTNVTIYYRGETPDRLAGYYLYLSNSSSSKTDGHLCFHDEEPDVPNVIQNVPCNHVGRHVIIYNERNSRTDPSWYSEDAVLELCDVQVYGCYKGSYSDYCASTCPQKCFEQHCYPGNGSCIWGCNCLHNNCDNSTFCNEGCKNGYGGTFCFEYNLASRGNSTSKQTTNGKENLAEYLIDGNRTYCREVIGTETLLQVDLDRRAAIKSVYIYPKNGPDEAEITQPLYITNTNDDLLKAHVFNLTYEPNGSSTAIVFQADNVIIGQYITLQLTSLKYIRICEIEVIGCPFGHYGQNCENECPANCFGCHPDSGKCVFGCISGWKGLNCNNSCQDQTFGKNCDQTCFCAWEEKCNPVNGICPSGECQKGWEGDSCSTECRLGTYSYNCNESCDGCLSNDCDKANGFCSFTGGCRPGWKPGNPKCDGACDDGFFGNCSLICHCRTGICNKTTGMCVNDECDKGWMGATCSHACKAGKFGINCEKRCTTCADISCDRMNGNCTHGCIAGYLGHQCLMKASSTDTVPSGIIGGIVASVLTVLIAVTIVIIYLRIKKRNQNKRERSNIYEATKEGEEDNSEYSTISSTDPRSVNLTVLQTKKGNMNPPSLSAKGNYDQEDNVYSYMTVGKITQIKISELKTAIQQKNRDTEFEKEFRALPEGSIHPHNEGAKEKNISKNRFRNLLPYDHSRVILKGNNGNDYINASYVDSYTRKGAYIATQGPKTDTRNDFWHMIWQEDVDVIVMVTKLERRCEQYWPDSIGVTLTTSHYKVSLIKETEHTVHIYRKLFLTDKEGKIKRVQQYQFTQWSDHSQNGEILDKISLTRFYRKVKNAKQSQSGPMVVHCRAGLGLTGTFIAIDALYESGKKAGFIDVMAYVELMRKDRMNMIQTKEQYIMVYDCLLELFTIPETSIHKSEFLSYLDAQKSIEDPNNRNILKYQFQKLQEIKPVYSNDCYSGGRSEENTAKNAFMYILPHDRFRPYIKSCNKSSSDYINAVTIPSNRTKDNYLVTQFPLQNTICDFWTMVLDYNCATIVLLEDIDEFFPLWPIANEDFEVLRLTQLENNKDRIYLQLSTNQMQNKNVQVFLMDKWSTGNLPNSRKDMLEFCKTVLSQRKEDDSSLTVVCRDGCGRSGIFLVLSLALERLIMDDDIDIFQEVRSIQTRRPEFIANLAQYEFCFNCMKDYLQEDQFK